MKKIVALLLTLILLACCCIGSAEASCIFSKKDIKTAVAVIAVEGVNRTIESMVKVAQKTTCNDAMLVKVATDVLAGAAFKVAEKNGVTIECETKDYVIDGQVVAIDPLIVINVH